ncbi:AAA ATPase domain-containing protein [Mucilaginibacter pineti]|uniref:AAA ATPase domain-containing protein n=1 Tax=Mucilaginibacter pineti TaxID=1391627 RepID=A0A1G7INK3_9SPHI|nr:AAA family ATPase [Mucilaginibacter pineti]SDF14126.1 AAA ATPase domain-containing protein [Mucilaginibacter pineti]
MPSRSATSQDFKIIAIRPQTDCDTRLSKVLERGRLYYFYSDYEITEQGITYKDESPDCLYHYRKLRLQICAVAGQNGSGKSTLIELLFMAVNNIARYYKVNPDLKPVQKLRVELFFKTEHFYKITVNGTDVRCFKLDGGKWTGDEELDFRDFFYTIAINYSHYAYNSRELKKGKDWITPLFHKNDGYQTPIVLNPKRDRGNIDINTEDQLVNQRLVANMLRHSDDHVSEFRKLTDHLSATHLVLKLIPRKSQGILYKKNGKEITLEKLNLAKEKIWKRVNSIYDFGLKNIDRKIEANNIALDYLICKLITIAANYEEYTPLFDQNAGNFNWKYINDWLRPLLQDKSHITFKLKQVLHFLKYSELGYHTGMFTLDDLSANIHTVIAQKQTHKIKLIALIPPPIFRTEILLLPVSGEKKINFKVLSSGEKQMIYSVSSILYHLSNLDSVTSQQKKAYRNVNILLEEIELYFHPEMQRNYIRYLRQSIIRLGLERIRKINICFVTHSPFILSDIPDKNVMFLKIINGVAQQTNLNKKTFGANIHDLLADGFFMENGFCGELAMERIKQTIRFLNASKELKEVKAAWEEDKENEALEDRMYELEADADFEERFNHLKMIKSIGEAVIARKLLEMYDDVFGISYEDKIREEITRLQQLIAK